MTKENMRSKWAERGMNIDKDCLCSKCNHILTDEDGYSRACYFAWDLYNFGDSCLGEK